MDIHWIKIIIYIHPYSFGYNFKISISRSKKFWMDIMDIHYGAIQLPSLTTARWEVVVENGN